MKLQYAALDLSDTKDTIDLYAPCSTPLEAYLDTTKKIFTQNLFILRYDPTSHSNVTIYDINNIPNHFYVWTPQHHLVVVINNNKAGRLLLYREFSDYALMGNVELRFSGVHSRMRTPISWHPRSQSYPPLKQLYIKNIILEKDFYHYAVHDCAGPVNLSTLNLDPNYCHALTYEPYEDIKTQPCISKAYLLFRDVQGYVIAITPYPGYLSNYNQQRISITTTTIELVLRHSARWNYLLYLGLIPKDVPGKFSTYSREDQQFFGEVVALKNNVAENEKTDKDEDKDENDEDEDEDEDDTDKNMNNNQANNATLKQTSLDLAEVASDAVIEASKRAAARALIVTVEDQLTRRLGSLPTWAHSPLGKTGVQLSIAVGIYVVASISGAKLPKADRVKAAAEYAIQGIISDLVGTLFGGIMPIWATILDTLQKQPETWEASDPNTTAPHATARPTNREAT